MSHMNKLKGEICFIEAYLEANPDASEETIASAEERLFDLYSNLEECQAEAHMDSLMEGRW